MGTPRHRWIQLLAINASCNLENHCQSRTHRESNSDWRKAHQLVSSSISNHITIGNIQTTFKIPQHKGTQSFISLSHMVKKEEGCCRKQENNEELTSCSLSYIYSLCWSLGVTSIHCCCYLHKHRITIPE